MPHPPRLRPFIAQSLALETLFVVFKVFISVRLIGIVSPGVYVLELKVMDSSRPLVELVVISPTMIAGPLEKAGPGTFVVADFTVDCAK